MLNESVSATNFDMRLMAPAEPAKPIGNVIEIWRSRERPVEPDPIFALIRAEQTAWDALGQAMDAEEKLEAAFDATEWGREPRAAIGLYTKMQDADFNPIPTDQLVEQVMYRTGSELALDHESQRAWIISADVTDERRAEMHDRNDRSYASLKEEAARDAAAIAAARQAFGLDAASARVTELSEATTLALKTLCTATPATSAGLLAMLDVCWARQAGSVLDDEAAASISGVFAAVRGFVAAEGSATAALRSGSASVVDPIFAALEAERMGYEARGVAIEANDLVRMDETFETWFAAERELYATAPTTQAGLAAMLARLSERTLGSGLDITLGDRTGDQFRLLVDAAHRLAGTGTLIVSPTQPVSLEAAE